MAGTGVGKFSSTAGSNTANMTVNFAENMAPSNVNNAARELMGHMRDMYEQLGDGYFEFGDGDGTYTVARGDADTITITSSADISGIYFAGRKIRITDGGANVVEGTIASSSHSSTTQTVNLTGISLASGTPTKVELGIDTAAFGGRVILDDDGDTYIEAVTDDTIDIYVAGAKDFVITANTFTAPSGSTIVVDDTTDASNTTSGSIQTDGGVGIAKKLFVGTDLDVDGTTNLDVVDIDGAVDMASTLGVSGVLTGTTAVFSSTSADDNFVITSTDADAGDPAPDLVLYRNSSSPANGDDIGRIEFRARNNNSQDIVPVSFSAFTAVVTDGAETGNFAISTLIGGSQINRMGFDTTETTFNDGSADLDFRVESNGNANMIFVNGGTDRVHFGGSSGDREFNFEGADNLRVLLRSGDNSTGACQLQFGDSDNSQIGRIMYEHDDNNMTFHTNATQFMELTSTGKIVLSGNTASSTSDLTSGGLHFHDASTADGNIMPITFTPSATADRARAGIGFISQSSGGSAGFAADIAFYTRSAADGSQLGTADERLRITSAGNVAIGGTSADSKTEITMPTSGDHYAQFLKHSAGSGVVRVLRGSFSGQAPDNATSVFITMGDSSTTRFNVAADGDVTNHDNAYGQISDERIKTNITDANSQWADIKAIKVKNFERKDDVTQYGEGKKVQIGVVAQEVETVSPGLIKEGEPTIDDIKMSSAFGTLYTADDAETKDGNDAVLYTAEDAEVIDGAYNVGDVKIGATHSKKIGDIKSLSGEKVKKVSYSVLYMKAIKALQEAQTRIETLETKVAALEG